MSLAEMDERGELEPMATSPEEIGNLLTMAGRRLQDAAATVISNETRLVQAYQAILACATAALRANEFRVAERGAKHFHTIETLKYTIVLPTADVSYCQRLRRKRHEDNYEGILSVSDSETTEAVNFAKVILLSTSKYLAKDFNHLLDS